MKRILCCPRIEQNKIFCNARYIEFFKECQCILMMPLMSKTSELKKQLDEYDALLLPGGGDLDPSLYGVDDTNIVFDRSLDDYEMRLIDLFLEAQKPIIGICRGLQTLNVYFNGTLKSHIEGHLNTYHQVISLDSSLNFLNNQKINSYHHQSIKKIAPNLISTLISDDHEIEAIKHRYLKVYGFQFHPEMLEGKLRLKFIKYLRSVIK